MTSQELTAWRSRMGWTAKAASEALGLSQHGYAAYERGHVFKNGDISFYNKDFPDRHGIKTIKTPRPIPKHVALACAAIEAGLSAVSASAANP